MSFLSAHLLSRAAELVEEVTMSRGQHAVLLSP